MLEAEPQDLGQVVERVVAGMSPLAARHDCALRVQVPPAPVIAEVDGRRVERVLRNLVGNAIEHGAGEPVEVTLAASGTAAAIGGPFLALVLQHERPERVRSTLAVFFVAGSLLGLGGLLLGGELTRAQVVAGLVWLPFGLLGYVVGAPVRARTDPERFRRGVLAFCVLASLTVIVRAALA